MTNLIGAIILAAGGSSRLGEPKQFLVFRGKSLIRRAVEAAMGSGCSPVIVVAGRDRERLTDEIGAMTTRMGAMTARIVNNPDWERGIGSSIRAGVKAILELEPALHSVVLMVCDQPFADAERIAALAEHRPPDEETIVASTYEGVMGVPALFGRVHLRQLQNLPDHRGAQSLFSSQQFKTIRVCFPKGGMDIDTAEDYRRLIREFPEACGGAAGS